MRVLRLLAFVAVVALVYFAQYIFDHGTLADFYPNWLLSLLPPLRRTTRWLPADLLVFAQWISAIGLLSFGLLAPMWTGETNRLYRRVRDEDAAARMWRWSAGALLVAALILAVLNGMAQARTAEPRWLVWSWLGSIALVLGAGYALNQAVPGVVYARRYREQVRPWQNWHGLVFLLVILALLFTFELRSLPPRVDNMSASVGLGVRGLLQGEFSLFAGAGGMDVPLPGLVLAALMTWASQDALAGIRLAGVLAGLLMVSGVWLMASELFRRLPRYGEFGEVLEDDGRWLTFVAAALAAVGVAVYHFARVPLYLEAVALGTLALWALLRGLRTGRPWLLAASGLGLGWLWSFGPVALTFSLVALATWIGVSVLERGWLAGKTVSAQDTAVVTVQRGAGWVGFGLWLAGLVVAVAPLGGAWLAGTAPGPFAWPAAGTGASAPGLAQLGHHLRLTVLGLNQLPDASGLVSGSHHLLPSLLAPLLLLAVGGLLLNMDSLMGWVIVTWLGGALAGAAIISPVDPFWPAMLPILPAAGLALAFFMDRARVLVMESLGTWTLQATVYLALGAVVAAGMFSWIAFYRAASNDIDLASVIGRAADLPGQDVQMFVVNGQENLEAVLEQPVVRLLAGDEALPQAIQMQAGVWPESLPAPARVLVAPADVGLVPLVNSLYPGGIWQVQRNLLASPVLYIYDLPEARSP